MLGRRPRERGHDNQDLALLLAGKAALELIEERAAPHRLVGNHEDAVDTVIRDRRHLRVARLDRASALDEVADGGTHLDPEQDRPGDRVDDRREKDHRDHRDPDDQDDPEHLRLGDLHELTLASELKNVNRDKNDDPHDVYEVPVDAGDLYAQVILRSGTEVALVGADVREGQEQ